MTEFNLPNKTVANKFIPKKTIINRITNGRKVLRDVERMFLSYKLSPTTININSTKKVEEIHIITVLLKTNKVPKDFLKKMNNLISYPVLFVLKYNSNFCYSMSLIEEDRIYTSKWNKRMTFVFSGTNLEYVYENLIVTFLDSITHINRKNKYSFIDLINIDYNIERLNKEITSLEVKIRREGQLNKQMDLNTSLKKRIKELEEYKEK